MEKRKKQWNTLEWALIAFFGILLILIATPAYQDRKMHLRQNEAKLALINLYTAERSYAVAHSTYTACVMDLGLNLVEQRLYAVGFSEKAATSRTCGLTGTEPCNQRETLEGNSTLCSNAGITPYQIDATHQITSLPNFLNSSVNPAIQSGTRELAQPSHLSSHAFTVFAVGNVSIEPQLDSWSINDRKELVHFP